VVFYVLFGAVFVGGIVGYWVVTRVLRDPGQIYTADTAPSEAPRGSGSPNLGKA
jgi:hypothetical protein